MLSVLDVFRVGIGPSSSHTVGPMRVAKRFVEDIHSSGTLASLAHLSIKLQGSLAFTGEGHATPLAVIYGLLGFSPETIDTALAKPAHDQVYSDKKLMVLGLREITFDPAKSIVLDFETAPDLHPNQMELIAYGPGDTVLLEATYYSTGGGFIATRQQLESPAPGDLISTGTKVAFPFASAQELLEACGENQCSIAQIVAANEDAFRTREETNEQLDRVVEVMMGSIDRGLVTNGLLPGSLKVRRRAPGLWNKLASQPNSNEREQIFDWLNVYAMAVNEENASGGQVVTAPTNGAAGIIPSIIRHYCMEDPKGSRRSREFLLTAGGIGLLYKQRASISGAEMGCQGEVGVACSMAAGGLAAVWGASPGQVTCAAEIAMEHNLGLTCDPVAGLVQIPCIERNAIGAVKAANAARLAIHRSEVPNVSLDQVIETMRQTGLDMSSKYKETSQGGLAVNVVEC